MFPNPIVANPESIWVLGMVVLMVLFGHRLPQIARGLGASVNEFKKGLKEGDVAAPQEVEVKK